MATNINEETYEMKDFSGAVQRKTSQFFKRDNEVKMSINTDHGRRLGGITKMRGGSQTGDDISTTTSTSTSTSSSTSTSTSTSSTTTA